MLSEQLALVSEMCQEIAEVKLTHHWHVGRGSGRGTCRSPHCLMLCVPAEQSGLALVFQPEALAVDADDDLVVKNAIEHRRSEHGVAGESGIPTAESEIRSEDH